MPIGTGTFIEFRSHIGNTIVAPDFWTSEDFGSRYVLRTSDNHAVIWLLTFTVEGSGTIEAFRDWVMLDRVPADPSAWKSSEWSPVMIGQDQACMRDLVSNDPQAKSQWRLYVLQAGKYYHVAAINVSTLTAVLNLGFYHDVVRSFCGIRA
jgi:hypothetical protein